MKDAAIQRFHELSEICDQLRAQHHRLLIKDEEVERQLEELTRLRVLTDEPEPFFTTSPSPFTPSSALLHPSSTAPVSVLQISPPEDALKPRRGGSQTFEVKHDNKENTPPPGYVAARSSNSPYAPVTPPPRQGFSGRPPRPVLGSSPLRFGGSQ